MATYWKIELSPVLKGLVPRRSKIERPHSISSIRENGLHKRVLADFLEFNDSKILSRRVPITYRKGSVVP